MPAAAANWDSSKCDRCRRRRHRAGAGWGRLWPQAPGTGRILAVVTKRGPAGGRLPGLVHCGGPAASRLRRSLVKRSHAGTRLGAAAGSDPRWGFGPRKIGVCWWPCLPQRPLFSFRAAADSFRPAIPHSLASRSPSQIRDNAARLRPAIPPKPRHFDTRFRKNGPARRPGPSKTALFRLAMSQNLGVVALADLDPAD